MTVVPNILQSLPGSLPSEPIPDDTNAQDAASSVLESFPNFQTQHFTEDSIWRDSFGLTGTLRTFYSGSKIVDVWALLSKQRSLSLATVASNSANIIRIGDATAWLECSFTFTTEHPSTACSGVLSLVPAEDGKWKIWLMKTILEQLPGQGDVDSALKVGDLAQRTNGYPESDVEGQSQVQGRDVPKEFHNTSATDTSSPGGGIEHFQAVIIGGGQSGLSVGGRLQALGVNYVILEQLPCVGDSWRQRYDSARLHTIREFGQDILNPCQPQLTNAAHLPFERTFGPDHEEYISKVELGEGHKKWAKRYNINIRNGVVVESGVWDEYQGVYHLKLRQSGLVSRISARHVVFATGAGCQTPVLPNLPGKEKFAGEVLHSVDYINAKNWSGKAGIVVGTANTGHDVADDMQRAGMSVTMVQRNRTFVLPAEYIQASYQTMYDDRRPTEESDRMMFAGPVSISRILSGAYFHARARAEPERWAALERAGFKVDPYGDIMEVVNIRLGGHYIDVGTSAKISKGLIKIKSDAIATTYTENGLAFSDGSEVRGDVIVFATGFVGNMRLHVERLFGKEIGDRAGDCFGLNEEGEILGAFKPLEQPGLWYIGGTLGHSRYYSRFIALSIKADDMGAPLPVYNDNQHKLKL